MGYYIYISFHNNRVTSDIRERGPEDQIGFNMQRVQSVPPDEDFIIADFEQPDDTTGIDIYSGDFSVVRRNPLNGKFSLEFNYLQVRYPAIEFRYMPRNWEYYRELSVKIYNTSDSRIRFLMRVDDQLSQWHPNPFFGRVDDLPPGYSEFEYPVDKIGLSIDIHDIRRIVISLEQPPSPGSIIIDDIILHY
ncbi:MAG: hypothetical protein GF307_12025 [candidate division Zixibacteria bacterium]|nr:hypothetical protein [candidate division Zixibacteria bacterium]